MLSALNTDTNASAVDGDVEVVAKQNLCPMCRSKKKCPAFMRNLSSEAMLIPDSLCWSCATRNPDFIVTEDEVARILDASGEERDIEMGVLLKRSLHNAEVSATEHILALEAKSAEEVDDQFDSTQWEETSLLGYGGSQCTGAEAQTNGADANTSLASSPVAASTSNTVTSGSNGTMGAQVRTSSTY